jgi:hypothetical protein
MLRQKLEYFVDSARKRLSGLPIKCPSCGGMESGLVQRKYVVTELRKCSSCRLLFRYPGDSGDDNQEFYQVGYSQGPTTELPSPSQLSVFLKNGFRSDDPTITAYLNYSRCVEILRSLDVPVGARVVDFGSSWGYGTLQFQKAGYEAIGYEISEPRAM